MINSIFYIIIYSSSQKKILEKIINSENKSNLNSALPLLEKMLKYDPCQRISAKEALSQEFFKEVRENKNNI